jgi:hypothetical protein
MMSDRNRRLRPSEVERLLRQAGRLEAPPGAKERALLVASSALSGFGGAAAGNAAASKGAAASITKAGSLAVLKWVGVASIAGVGAMTAAMATRDASLGTGSSVGAVSGAPSPVAGAHGITRSGQAKAVEDNPRRALPPLEGTPPAPPLPARTTAAGPAVAAQDGAASRTTSPAIRVAAAAGDDPVTSGAPWTAMPGPRVSTVRAELATLDAARGAIAADEPARALSILEAYSARFPGGAMAPEAAVLRVEGLLKAGDRSAARRFADAFLATDPDSVYVERLQSMLEMSKP